MFWCSWISTKPPYSISIVKKHGYLWLIQESGWWGTISGFHLIGPFYTTASFVHHFVTISELRLELRPGNAQIGPFVFLMSPLALTLVWTSLLSMVITLKILWYDERNSVKKVWQTDGRTWPFIGCLVATTKTQGWFTQCGHPQEEDCRGDRPPLPRGVSFFITHKIRCSPARTHVTSFLGQAPKREMVVI